MTYHELMTGLLQKGYQPRKCGDHMEGSYCCARAVYDLYDDFRDDPAVAEEMLRNFLELDRLEVFRSWYSQGEGEPNPWDGHLLLANSAYAGGHLDACVAYLLKPLL
jgi:hypothetical protein